MSLELPRDETFSVNSFVKRIHELALREKRNKAADFLKQSDFIELCQKAADKIDAEVSGNAIVQDLSSNIKNVSDESTFVELLWGEDWTGEDNYTMKSLVVEALYTGVIIVHGNVIGSTVLHPDEWASQEAKKRALQKAFDNPHLISGQWSRG